MALIGLLIAFNVSAQEYAYVPYNETRPASRLMNANVESFRTEVYDLQRTADFNIKIGSIGATTGVGMVVITGKALTNTSTDLKKGIVGASALMFTVGVVRIAIGMIQNHKVKKSKRKYPFMF